MSDLFDTNTAEDLKAVLDDCLKSAKSHEATHWEIKAKAISMAKRGYKFDATSYGLVRDLMNGRGLLLSGGVGWGKSFFFYCAGVPALNMKLAQSKHVDEIMQALDNHRDEAVLIDDLGIEEREYKDFGTSVKLIDLILEKRGESNAPTHFTTNLTPAELQERYGDRVIDRIRGMAFLCEVTGESKRDPDAIGRDGSWYDAFWESPIWEVCARNCGYYDRDERKCTKGKVKEPRAYQRRGYQAEPVCPHYRG